MEAENCNQKEQKFQESEETRGDDDKNQLPNVKNVRFADQEVIVEKNQKSSNIYVQRSIAERNEEFRKRAGKVPVEDNQKSSEATYEELRKENSAKCVAEEKENSGARDEQSSVNKEAIVKTLKEVWVKKMAEKKKGAHKQKITGKKSRDQKQPETGIMEWRKV